MPVRALPGPAAALNQRATAAASLLALASRRRGFRAASNALGKLLNEERAPGGPCARPQVGERDPDIFFTDRPREYSAGQRNKECVSLFADEEPGLLKGRSPVQCYTDFMRWGGGGSVAGALCMGGLGACSARLLHRGRRGPGGEGELL